MKVWILLAGLALPIAAQAVEKQEINTQEAVQRVTLAREAIKMNPPRAALLDSPLAAHPMFTQVFNSLNEAQINEAAAMLMAETFTSKELKALVDFQNSPEGKQIQLKMPAYQKLLGATLQNYLGIAFQQMMVRQGSASSLPANPAATPASGSLPPMILPEEPATPAMVPAPTPPTGGAGTPLKAH